MLSRRTLLWTVPTIVAAVAVPAQAASEDIGVPARACAGENGVYAVEGNRLTITYTRAPDIYEVNARGEGWSASYGTNYGTAPANGSPVWMIELPDYPIWVQVHTFNNHLGETC